MENYSLLRAFMYWIIGLLVYLFIPLSQTGAVGEFTANYDVSYAIAPSGVTIVTQSVSLVNHQTNLYPKQYTILLDTLNVRNIIAHDDGGTITPTITQDGGKTEILLSFNKQIVGLGKQTQFTLRYENLDIAQKNGSIWEVNIPGITDDADLGTYNVNVQTPPTFGPTSYLKPLPADGKRWNRDQMIQGGISAAYGDKQYAKLTLRYYLENKGLASGVQEIALPPDSAFQRVSIDSLSPKPEEVIKDDDGNWLARYALKPGQKLSIEAGVTVMLSLPSLTASIATASGKQWEENELSDYRKSLPFWESDDASIKALAVQYTNPKDIYDYIVRTLTYDHERVKTTPKRKGAIAALKTPQSSICMEFTDLFIAIARAAGIPAREVVGYAHTTNPKRQPVSLVSDILHAWPEYYDQERGLWIPVDPTWGNTTGGVDYFSQLDFNHIVFAIHGKSSSLPLPAGFYRENGKEGKDVTVQFLESPGTPPIVTLIPRINFPTVVTAGFRAYGEATVENTSGVEATNIAIRLETSPFSYIISKESQSIAPYSKVVIPINVAIPTSITRSLGAITMTAGGRSVAHSFDIQPISWLYLSLSGMIGSTGILLWIIITRPFSKRKHKK
ncbi:MAG: transglutaminase domain-containing protein [Patescibacteria group bacterium]|mgnify:CR=1 FL=1